MNFEQTHNKSLYLLSPDFFLHFSLIHAFLSPHVQFFSNVSYPVRFGVRSLLCAYTHPSGYINAPASWPIPAGQPAAQLEPNPPPTVPLPHPARPTPPPPPPPPIRNDSREPPLKPCPTRRARLFCLTTLSVVLECLLMCVC